MVANVTKSRIGLFAVGAALLVGLLFGFWYGSFSSQSVQKTEPIEKQLTAGVETKSRPPKTSTPIQRPSTDGTVAVPTRYQLPGVSSVRATARDSKEWLSSFGGEEQKLSAFNKSHFDIYSINSPEQIAWMAQNGYPMPEDVIAAESMSSEKLRELASAGNTKAAFLLHERDLDALKDTFATYDMMHKSRSEFWQADPAGATISNDQDMFAKLLRESDSPYKGYATALSSSLSTDPVDASSKIVAGLLWSESLGDARVGQYLQSYSASDPLNAAVLMGADAASANLTTTILKMRAMGCQPITTAGEIPGIATPTD